MWIAMLAAVAVHSCHAVDGDQILMSDLAQVDARFSAAPAEQSAGYAPQSGAKRVFWPGELIQLAERNGIATTEPFQQMCFELRTRVLSMEEIAAAVRTWAPEPARIEVLEQSRFPAPNGRVVFDRPQTPQETRDGAMFLHGYVLFHGSQHFPVWARVRVRVKKSVVVAAAEMIAGTEVTPEQLRMEDREVGIATEGLASSPSELLGRVPKMRILAGSALLFTQFERAIEVSRGTTVQVEVRDGSARLAFEAPAETNGRVGDFVSVMNPTNKKTFRAKVVGKNSVLVSSGIPAKDLQEVTEK